MLSFVEQLIKVSYNLNDLLWYSTAEQKILFLQERSTLVWYRLLFCVLFTQIWGHNVLMDLQIPSCHYSSIRDESICTKLQHNRTKACHPQLEA